MSITITPNIEAGVAYFKKLKNITNVVVNDVPPLWKEKINNVDSLMLTIYRNDLFIDLVIPMATVNMSFSPTFIKYSDRMGIMINGLIDKAGYTDCIMCINNDFLESFYYFNPENNIIEEREIAYVKQQLSPLEKNLVRYLLTVPFVKEAYIYDIPTNPEYVLIACNIINLQYTGNEPYLLNNPYSPPHGTRYKALVPVYMLNDISLQKTIIDHLTTYYNNTVNDAQVGVYHPDLQPVLPDYLQNKL